MRSYLSVDLEDYRDATMRDMGLPPRPNPEQTWRGVRAILGAVNAADGAKKLTFFVTGQVARQQPDLLAYLARDGHEIGCHGDVHENVWDLNRQAFAAALDRAVTSIERAAGTPPRGFRAPNFSIDARCPWVHEVLAESGFHYDSSYVSSEPRPGAAECMAIEAAGRTIYEFPIYRHRFAGPLAVRVIGGTYFRLLPSGAINRLLRIGATAGYAPIIYLHAADVDDRCEAVTLAEMESLSVSRRLGWAARQRQWSAGSSGALAKLATVLAAFPNRGPMGESIQ